MKSIRIHQFGDPDVLKLEDIPTPTPASDQILIRVKAIGVNPVETYIRSGRYGPREFPFTPGTDAAGIVETIGPGVAGFKPGDRVYTASTLSGAYAQLTLAAESKVFPLPPNVTFQQGAALGIPAATAYRALFHRAQVKPGETVLVHGATGGVGLFAVQLARAHGCTVFGTGGSPEGRALILKEGCHHALDHNAPGYLDELMKLTGGRGVDVILEMLANVNLDKDLAILAKFGRVIVIGNRGRIEIDPRQTMARDADIRGMTLFNTPDDELTSIHRGLIAALEAGTLRPIIDTELPLSEAARAHREVMERNSRGKMVLLP